MYCYVPDFPGCPNAGSMEAHIATIMTMTNIMIETYNGRYDAYAICGRGRPIVSRKVQLRIPRSCPHGSIYHGNMIGERIRRATMIVLCNSFKRVRNKNNKNTPGTSVGELLARWFPDREWKTDFPARTRRSRQTTQARDFQERWRSGGGR